LIPLLLGAAFAAEIAAADAAIDDALASELDRAMRELRLPDQPGAYFGALEWAALQDVGMEASLGAMIRDDREPVHQIGAELRVGDPLLDNVNFDQGWEEDGFDSRALPLGLTPHAARRAAWRLLDSAFKAAVANRGARIAARTGQDPAEHPTFFPGVAANASADAPKSVDPEPLAALARTLSGRLAPLAGAGCLEDARVQLAMESGVVHRIESTGARFSRPASELVVSVVAYARADEELAWDAETWVVKHPSDLPSEAAMLQRVDALGSRLQAWCAAPKLEAPWVGPVIFEGEAAIDLSSALLHYRLSGTPQAETEDPPTGPGSLRLKRRVLPIGVDLIDDPRRWPTLPSSYDIDAEGQPARAVQVIDDGIVRALLGSRTVTKETPESTGHAHGWIGELKRAAPAQVLITADRPLSGRALVSTALKLARPYDLDEVLIIRRVKDRAFEPYDPDNWVAPEDRPAIDSPIVAVRRFADGHEEPVRGLRFEDLALHILKDAIPGPSHRRTWLRTPDGDWQRPTVGFPVTWESPSWLIPEVLVSPVERSKPAPMAPFPGRD
jgi:TldD protein